MSEENTNDQLPDHITVQEAREREQQGAQLVDVREIYEYTGGHAQGAKNIPLSNLPAQINEISRDVPVLLICQSGVRSKNAQNFLKQQKITNVINVDGGTKAWQAAGLPLEK